MAKADKDRSAEPLAIIGCGHIGGALLLGLAKNPDFKDRTLIACDNDTERVTSMQEEFGVTAETDCLKAFAAADVVVIAVKPKDFLTLASRFSSAPGSKRKTIISVVVGVTVAQLSACFPNVDVVRVMPNIPMVVGLGMSCIFGPSERARRIAEEVFGTCGLTIQLDREEELDIGQAVASCGPAFLYLAAESMIDGAVFAGMSRETAELITAQTMLGSAGLMLESENSPAELRATITTPGGTTAEGLYALEKAGVRAAYMKAVGKSVMKARTISKKLGEGS